MHKTIIKVKKSDKGYINTISNWIYYWWGKAEGYSKEEINSFCNNAISSDTIPQTFLALIDGQPAGMYHILMSDCKVRPDIYPWLTDLFVAEKFRGQGVGVFLINSVIEKAKEFHLNELFLYTHHDDLYEKFGWKFIEHFNPYTTPEGIQKLYRLDIEKPQKKYS